jgi:hypothetical protein
MGIGKICAGQMILDNNHLLSWKQGRKAVQSGQGEGTKRRAIIDKCFNEKHVPPLALGILWIQRIIPLQLLASAEG